jgi:diguanylate cyclase (GGDEF)-like protein
MLQEKLSIFFGSNVPLRERLFYAISAAGIVSAIVGLISTFMAELSLGGILAAASCIMTLIAISIYVIKTKNFDRASILISTIFNLLIFPINFIYAGGIEGGMPMYFIMGIFATFLLVTGKIRNILILLFFIVYIALLLSSYYNPDMIVPFPSAEARIVDLIFAMVIVSGFTGIVISIIVYEYSTEHEKVELLNHRLHQVAIKDPLTNLFNRRYLMNQLNYQIEKANQEEYDLALIIFDIDFFKSINDTYGHLIGDEVLKEFSKLLSSQIRGDDIVGRYGGEEFFLILVETDSEDALHLAERIRKKVSNSILSKKITNSITISGGIGIYQPDMSVEQLIVAADKNLYKAKSAGRNKIISI